MTFNFKDLSVKLFADGADLKSMLDMNSKPYISGLTTNPTLMRKAGITNYAEFAKKVLREIKIKPISFEVFSDNLDLMKKQGESIASWGENVYVKVPIVNTKGESTKDVIRHLVNLGIKVNITAVFTIEQVKEITKSLDPNIPSYISVFAGRIADTGRNPEPIIIECLDYLAQVSSAELIWASPRELLNVFQADKIGCHIITATSDILTKLDLVDKNLYEYSLETVKMFHNDAMNSGYNIDNE